MADDVPPSSSFANTVRFEDYQYKQNVLDRAKSVRESFANARGEKTSEQNNEQQATQNSGQGTSYAKVVQLDGYRENSLDRAGSTKPDFNQAKDPEKQDQSKAQDREKMQPGNDLKPAPETRERYAVDAQIHNEKLAAARERAKDLAQAVRDRQHDGPSRDHGR